MTGRNPIEARDVQTERVRWRYRNRIAEATIHEVAGRPDTNKSTWAAHVAAHISKQVPVVISSAEEIPALMTKPRLEAAGANLDNIRFWRVWFPNDMKRVSEFVRANGVGLLVIDPLSRHLTSGVNRFTDSMARVLDPLQELCEDTGLSVLVVDHVIKKVSASEDPLNAVGGGSSGMASAARAVYVLGIDPENADGRYLATVKCNLRLWERSDNEGWEALRYELDSEDHPEAGPVPLLVPHSEAKIDPMRLLRKATRTGRPANAREEAKNWLESYLAGAKAPVRAATIIEDARAHHITSKTLHNARKELPEIVVNPPGGGRNCTWCLRQFTGKQPLQTHERNDQ